MFLPNNLSKLEGIYQIIVWLLIEQIHLVVSGQAEERIKLYNEEKS
jgi:hypothetical protein